jgi:hypothetical protein
LLSQQLVTRDPSLLAKLVTDGAIEDLVALMKSFPFNSAIQANGLKSLSA